MFSKITNELAVGSAFDEIPSGWTVLDVRGLIDGSGNSPSLIDDYVAAGLKMLQEQSQKLVIVCDYGQSRSNFIAAHVLSKVQAITLDVSLELVRSKHPDSRINAALLVSKVDASVGTAIRRIVVTGGRGFIGTRLCSNLNSAGFDLTGLTRSHHGDYLSSSTHLNTAIPGGCDLLIHFAHPKPFNAESTSQEAMSQLISVVEYCIDHGIRLLYPSGWVVFDGSSEQLVSRVTPVHPHTRYGRLKATAEAYLKLAAAEGLDARVLRLPGMFGADSLEPRFLRYFAACVKDCRNIVFHAFENGSARIPLSNVDACIKAIGNLVADFHSLQFVTHVGPAATSPTVRDIAERVAREAGQKVQSAPINRAVFNGHFVPDISVDTKVSVADEINDFIFQLSRETNGSR